MMKPVFRSATPPASRALAAAAVCAGIMVVPALAQAQQAGQQTRPGESRTIRSDGTVAAQVSQTPRREQRRQVRVTSSTQALPAPDSWQVWIDPPEGGQTVAPAGTVAGDGTAVPLVGVVDIPLRPAASGRPRPAASPAEAGLNR